MIKLTNTPVKVIVAAFILIQPYFWINHFYAGDRAAIHISLVGPADQENSYVNGVRLFVRELNQNGGIHGREVRLNLYDDNNAPAKAIDIASSIVEEGNTVAVIGHQTDACTEVAGEIYRKAGIPVLSPSVMGRDTVANNDWLFRTVFDRRLQSTFIAHYINNIFDPKSVLVISDQIHAHQSALEEFDATLKSLGVPISQRWELGKEETDRSSQSQAIAAAIEKIKNISLPIVLFANPQNSVHLIQHLKDQQILNPIITPVAYANNNFSGLFQELPKEKMHPGFYTDGIYAVSAFFYELANEKAQRFQERFQKRYHTEPNWEVAYAHDAIMILTEGIKHVDIRGQPESLKSDREKIRQFLTSLSNVKDSLEGVTGLNFFDKSGNSFKPVSMGIYKRTRLIPAPYQFQIIKDIKEISTLEEDLDDRRIIEVGQEYFYKTSVVHTGIEILELDSLDEENLTFNATFYLWFRYNQGDIDINTIEFLNALKPIKLKIPVAEEIVDQSVYRRYKIEETFWADFIPSEIYQGHVLGMAFRHKHKTRKELQFIKDELGMVDQNRPLLTENNQILNSLYNWDIVSTSFFQDISNKRTWGNIKYIDHQEKTVEHSRFTAKIQIKKSSFSPRLLIPEPFSGYLLLGNLFLLGLFLWFREDPVNDIAAWVYPNKPGKGFKGRGSSYFIEKSDDARLQAERIINKKREMLKGKLDRTVGYVRILLSFSMLILLETVLVQSLLGIVDEAALDTMTKAFDVLWWIIPAKMLNDLIQKNIYDAVEARSDRKVPALIRGFTSFLIYLLTSFGVIAFVFDFKITGLVATSGILMMIVGLAIQLNIANIFSGIAINLERPYHVGDWVKVGNFSEGRVIDINWRTTRFEDKMGCIFAIPNSTVAESLIHNFSLPSDLYNDWISVHIDAEHDPDKVKNVLLQAVTEVHDHVLKDPEPWVYFYEITDTSAVYLVGWSSHVYRLKTDVRQLVWLSIWKHLDKANIKPAVRRQAIQLHQEQVRELPLAVQQHITETQ